MEDFFTDQPQYQAPTYEYQPHHDQPDVFQFDPTPTPIHPPPAFDFSATPTAQIHGSPEPDNDFNDFEEDETTRRIREEEDRIQRSLKEKSDREWEDKQRRREDGRRQLEEFSDRKESEKRQRAEENVRREREGREESAKLNTEAGWKKVMSNINVRSGEHKGTKEIGRMREAILHRREDDAR